MELLKNCEKENCPGMVARRQLLDETIKKKGMKESQSHLVLKGIPKYSQDILPECDVDPGHCISIAQLLTAFKKSLRTSSYESYPTGQATLVTANKLALALESVILQLIPFEQQVDYSAGRA